MGSVIVRCPACNHDNRADRRFCAECGGRLGPVCPSCATPNEPGERFCGHCGTTLNDSAQFAGAEVAPPGRATGERRQLTVLFCDLVGSTELSARMDPEDWRTIIADYHRTVAATVERFGGHVAKYLGDGLLVYFGYPQAHEDDAERAVRAGLAVAEGVKGLGGTGLW
jgi:class 3 adenylate cyclase